MNEYKKMTDNELVLLFQKDRNKDASAAMYERHKALLYKESIWAAGRSVASVDECLSHASEALLIAMKSFDTTRGECKFSTYLVRAVRSRNFKSQHAHGAIRVPYTGYKTNRNAAEKANSCGSLSGMDRENFDVAENDCDSPLTLLSEREDIERLHSAMSLLSDRRKFVLTRRFFDGLTLKVVGEELGVTKERVRQIETDALAKLREYMVTVRCTAHNWRRHGFDRKGKQRWKCTICKLSKTDSDRAFRRHRHSDETIREVESNEYNTGDLRKVLISKCTIK